MEQIRNAAAALVFIITGGRIITPAARRRITETRKAWKERAEKIQKELDAERSRGWGFRYCDGRRIDF